MKKSYVRGLVVVFLALMMSIGVFGCSAGHTSSDMSSTSSAGTSSATDEDFKEAQNQTKDFWEDTEYANPNRLTEDREFLVAYTGMDGIESVNFGKLEVSDSADTLFIPFTCEFAPFEWGGVKYVPVLSQMEVKLGNGEVVRQTYFTMPGEDMTWVVCKDKDIFKGSDVSVRLRAVINPTGGKECAYSEWTEWQDMKVELGPAEGEQIIVDASGNYEGLAQ